MYIACKNTEESHRYIEPNKSEAFFLILKYTKYTEYKLIFQMKLG